MNEETQRADADLLAITERDEIEHMSMARLLRTRMSSIYTACLLTHPQDKVTRV